VKPDPHPRQIAFEFDREKLRRYLRLRGLTLWIIGLGGIGSFIGFCTAMDMLQRAHAAFPDKLPEALIHFASLGGGGLVLGLACYLVFSHRQAESHARSISLEVDGPFLRIREGGLFKTDRKIHFRSVVDYSLVEGPILRRCGLKTLRMAVPVGAPTGLIQVTGLLNCETVRDQLAEIDALRETEHARA
jgi:membrane protein YdbS with pleckstrin-like domain